jgi:transposase
MRKVYQGFTNSKIQVTSVIIKKGEKLIVDILNNLKKLLIYRKTAKKTAKPVIHVLIDFTLPLKTTVNKLAEYEHE